MSKANDTQIGGGHYQHPGFEEHWDRAYRLRYDNFQYIITKWVERWRDKDGIKDLLKAQHAIAKYIEVAVAEREAEIDEGEDLAAAIGGTVEMPIIDIEDQFCNECE